MSARPKALKYRGKMLEAKDLDGNVVMRGPDRFYTGIPARDLDEADIAQLSDEQLKNAMGGDDPLYVEPKAKVEERADSKAKDDDKAEKPKDAAVAAASKSP